MTLCSRVLPADCQTKLSKTAFFSAMTSSLPFPFKCRVLTHGNLFWMHGERCILRKGDLLATLARIERKTHEVMCCLPKAMQSGCLASLEITTLLGKESWILYHWHLGFKGQYISILFPIGVIMVSANKSHVKIKHLRIKKEFFRN